MIGSLKELKASPAAQARYRTAVQHFLRVCLGIYGFFARSDTEPDELCSESIKLAWQEGEARGQAAYVISVLQFTLGRRKLLPQLGMAWGLGHTRDAKESTAIDAVASHGFDRPRMALWSFWVWYPDTCGIQRAPAHS